MRVLLFLPSFLPEIGGMEKAADMLAMELHSMGHEPAILAQRPRRAVEAVKRPYPIVYHHRLRSATWFPFSAEVALARLHRRFSFDVINAYQAYWTGYTAVRFGRRHNVPVVISSRGGDIREGGRYLTRPISRKRTVWALHHATAVTTLSNQHAQRVSTLTGGAVKSHVIHNGVEPTDEKSPPHDVPARFADLKDVDFVLTLGRLRIFKGLDLLLDAMKVLKERRRIVPVLVIAGEGPERSRLLRQAEAHNLIDCIRFTGWVTETEKTWLLANCKVLAQPSRSEGMPNSVLEAMSRGKPILATTVGGLPEIVRDEINGFLVEPDNVTALTEAWEKVLDVDLEGLGRNARAVAAAHHWDRIAGQYLSLYESATAHSARSTE